MGPITGKAAFIGKEQLGFSRYAVRRLARGEIKLVEGDTQLEPARARAVARTFHANRSILAVVGPAGSQEVLAVAPFFLKAERLPFISASATRAPLTNGSIPSFFRVVPSDSAQRRTIASFLRATLEANHVLIVDDRTTGSRALASGVQSRLRASGVTVTRTSVSQKVTDFSALVARIGSQVDAVFLPWQVAANAQLFGRELKARRKRAVIFGSDGLDSGDFRIEGSYVAAFAPDIRALEANAAFVAGYGARFVSKFGPPAYVATQAAIGAIKTACADGAATRAEVQRNLERTFIPRIVLGGSLRFTANGDRQGAKYSVFKLGPGGRKTLVG
jgi:ABC-type branched-subunit amino acid transport system substrate-binding protein